MRKLYLYAKFLHQEIRWNYGIWRCDRLIDLFVDKIYVLFELPMTLLDLCQRRYDPKNCVSLIIGIAETKDQQPSRSQKIASKIYHVFCWNWVPSDRKYDKVLCFVLMFFPKTNYIFKSSSVLRSAFRNEHHILRRVRY